MASSSSPAPLSFLHVLHDTSSSNQPLTLHSFAAPSLLRRGRRRRSRLHPLRAAPAPLSGSGKFLSPDDLSRLELLSSYSFTHEFDSGGRLLIRPLSADEDADQVVALLSTSFSEVVSWAPAKRYAQLLAYLVRQYVTERRRAVPHAAVLVGYYGDDGDGEGVLACTAEMSFNAVGALATPLTPVPPPACPYICNMTVKASMRRKGIGKQLLRACEDLVMKMSTERCIYLHCRLVDTIPFHMYRKAGYVVVQTDSFLVWLSFQRRKHLMCKQLLSSSDDNSVVVELLNVR